MEIKFYYFFRKTTWVYLPLCLLFLSSCGLYQNRILFRTEAAISPANVHPAVAEAHANYIIQENDYLEVEVYTNQGEVIVDPNNEILKEISAGGRMQQQQIEKPRFLVRDGGFVKLPLIGETKLAGYTLHQADSLLEEQYSLYYEEAYVITQYANKRVVVLGATGGQVIPLQNENTNLLEILAMAGGVSNLARTDNIRLIRGDLNNPEVYIINLSTIEGMRQSSLKVMPNDVIYVEPVQRVTAEAIRDISPILGLVTSLITLGVLISRIN